MLISKSLSDFEYDLGDFVGKLNPNGSMCSGCRLCSGRHWPTEAFRSNATQYVYVHVLIQESAAKSCFV